MTAKCAKDLLGLCTIWDKVISNWCYLTIQSALCAVQKGPELHTPVLDKRGTVGVLCVLEDIIEMELKKLRVQQCGMYLFGSILSLTIR